MALALKVFQCLCLCCFFSTRACLGITSSCTTEIDTAVNLTCTNHPYTGVQIWIINEAEVLICDVISCIQSMSNPERFSFTNDISSGVFVLTIDPVLLSDNGTTVRCNDGVSEETFQIKVEAGPEGSADTTKENSKEREQWLIPLVVFLVLSLLLTSTCITVYKVWNRNICFRVEAPGDMTENVERPTNVNPIYKNKVIETQERAVTTNFSNRKPLPEIPKSKNTSVVKPARC